jgi:transcriptional regulator with XRE-family HTH domain
MKTAAQHAKEAGLPSLKVAAEISGESTQTLNNWLNNKPFVFFSVIEKSSKVYRMTETKNVLEFILSEIKKENEARANETTISDDNTNECLISVFHDALNKFENIELVDDEDKLIEVFGLDGLHRIRDAEQGIY